MKLFSNPRFKDISKLHETPVKFPMVSSLIGVGNPNSRRLINLYIFQTSGSTINYLVRRACRLPNYRAAVLWFLWVALGSNVKLILLSIKTMVSTRTLTHWGGHALPQPPLNPRLIPYDSNILSTLQTSNWNKH